MPLSPFLASTHKHINIKNEKLGSVYEREHVTLTFLGLCYSECFPVDKSTGIVETRRCALVVVGHQGCNLEGCVSSRDLSLLPPFCLLSSFLLSSPLSCPTVVPFCLLVYSLYCDVLAHLSPRAVPAYHDWHL